jgi:DNA helicase-2/ATP-dependent DNA helicase PcrA
MPIKEWIKNNSSDLETTSRCKFYVAITRARYSVAIVYDYKDTEDFPGIEKYCPLPKLSGSLRVNSRTN